MSSSNQNKDKIFKNEHLDELMKQMGIPVGN